MADTAVGDLEADLEFLMRAARKVETIREDLGKVGPVIAEQVEEAMLGRRTTAGHEAGRGGVRAGAQAAQVRAGPGQADQGPDATSYHETQRELRLDPENIQKVVEVALELAGQPPLEEAKSRPLARPEAEVMPGVPAARPVGELGAVRRGAGPPVHRGGPARSSSTTPCRKGREDVVLVHLNHRLVQMSLRLLRAEVWSERGPEEAEPGHGPGGARLVPCDTSPWSPTPGWWSSAATASGSTRRSSRRAATSARGGSPGSASLKEMQDVLAAATGEEPSEAGRSRSCSTSGPGLADLARIRPSRPA